MSVGKFLGSLERKGSASLRLFLCEDNEKRFRDFFLLWIVEDTILFLIVRKVFTRSRINEHKKFYEGNEFYVQKIDLVSVQDRVHKAMDGCVGKSEGLVMR